VDWLRRRGQKKSKLSYFNYYGFMGGRMFMGLATKTKMVFFGFFFLGYVCRKTKIMNRVSRT